MSHTEHRHWNPLLAGMFALSLVVQPAMGQTPAPVEPPGTPGIVVFVGDVGVSIRADSGTVPRGCNPTEVVQLLTTFLDAFNRGDQQTLPGFFPAESGQGQEGAFRWYSVNGPPGGFNPGFTAYHRDDLMPYVAERHEQGERMTLLEIDYGTSPMNRFGEKSHRKIGFTLDVLRSANDIPTHQAGVKGGIDCREQKITTWSMGHRGVVPDDWFNPPTATLSG